MKKGTLTTQTTKEELVSSLYKDVRKLNNREIENFYIKYNIEFLIDYLRKNNILSIEKLIHIDIFEHSKKRGHLQKAASFFKNLDANEIISPAEIQEIVIEKLKILLIKNSSKVTVYLNLNKYSLTFYFKHKKIVLLLDLKAPNNGTFFKKEGYSPAIRKKFNNSRSNITLSNSTIIKIIDWLNCQWFNTDRILCTKFCFFIYTNIYLIKKIPPLLS